MSICFAVTAINGKAKVLESYQLLMHCPLLSCMDFCSSIPYTKAWFLFTGLKEGRLHQNCWQETHSAKMGRELSILECLHILQGFNAGQGKQEFTSRQWLLKSFESELKQPVELLWLENSSNLLAVACMFYSVEIFTVTQNGKGKRESNSTKSHEV